MELPQQEKPGFMSKLKSKFQKSSKPDEPPPLEFPKPETPRPLDVSQNESYSSQAALHESGVGGRSQLNVTARRIRDTAVLYLSPAPAPPRTVNQYGEPMAILNPAPPKSICRFSNFLNLILILGLITGIILAACSGINEVAAVIGPCFIVLSIFAMCGKVYFTFLFEEDPIPTFTKYADKLDKKLDTVDWKLPQIRGLTRHPPASSSSAPPPPPSWTTSYPPPPASSSSYGYGAQGGRDSSLDYSLE